MHHRYHHQSVLLAANKTHTAVGCAQLCNNVRRSTAELWTCSPRAPTSTGRYNADMHHRSPPPTPPTPSSAQVLDHGRDGHGAGRRSAHARNLRRAPQLALPEPSHAPSTPAVSHHSWGTCTRLCSGYVPSVGGVGLHGPVGPALSPPCSHGACRVRAVHVRHPVRQATPWHSDMRLLSRRVGLVASLPPHPSRPRPPHPPTPQSCPLSTA